MSVPRLKMGAALVLCAPFIPLLFQGEEFGATTPFLYFTHHDEELGRSVSEGRRREFAEFGWNPAEIPDPQDPATFQRSKLDWTEMEREPHASLLEWHRQLIELRKSAPELTDGRLDRVGVEFWEDEGRLTLRRGAVSVACSLRKETVSVERALACDEGFRLRT
jgi:maltooligosyltrehalose trehalohydrolase